MQNGPRVASRAVLHSSKEAGLGGGLLALGLGLELLLDLQGAGREVLVAGADGKATLTTTTTRVTLSPGPISVFDADGTAIIVHANPDQGKTGEPKSGLSGGPRVACGVIQK